MNSFIRKCNGVYVIDQRRVLWRQFASLQLTRDQMTCSSLQAFEARVSLSCEGRSWFWSGDIPVLVVFLKIAIFCHQTTLSRDCHTHWPRVPTRSYTKEPCSSARLFVSFLRVSLSFVTKARTALFQIFPAVKHHDWGKCRSDQVFQGPRADFNKTTQWNKSCVQRPSLKKFRRHPVLKRACRTLRCSQPKWNAPTDGERAMRRGSE